MATICTNCAKEPALLRLIEAQGEVVPQCSVCKHQNVRAIDAQASPLIGLLRALMRFYYHEWDYNTHLGGENMASVFDAENPILQHGFEPEDLEDAVYPSLAEGYETADVPITLFAGYGEHGEQNEPLGALRATDHEHLLALRHRVATTNYYLLEDEVRDLLAPFRDKLERVLAADTTLYRARIGVADHHVSIFNLRVEFIPFADGNLSAPLPSLVGPGRLNRTGVSFLYLATEHTTAINEVRPHPGHAVSTGQFRNRRPLMVADFSALRLEEFATSDAALQNYWMLNSMDRAFSVPVPPEERTRYMLTQLLTDGVRNLGFDGVAYRSSVGVGVNLAFFDPSEFEYIPGSGRAVRIERVDYRARPGARRRARGVIRDTLAP
jgi:hypothetical protein